MGATSWLVDPTSKSLLTTLGNITRMWKPAIIEPGISLGSAGSTRMFGTYNSLRLISTAV
jgi:hypothetical protein